MSDDVSAQSSCRRCGADVGPEHGQCPSCGLFLPGNTLAVAHGATHSAALVKATANAATEVDAAIGGGVGSEPRYALSRDSAAAALARVRLLEAFLDDRGLLDGKGHPRPATKLLTEARASLLRHLEALGLTPSSAAKLGVDLGKMQGLSLAAKVAAERGNKT